MIRWLYRLLNHKHVRRLYLDSLIEAEQIPSIPVEIYVKRLAIWSYGYIA